MNAEWTTRPCGEGTLVELTLTTDRPRRVRVESTGDGPILPPRTDGVPDAGWDERGYTGVVDDHLGVGFATTDPPDDPPVRVEWRGPPEECPTFDGHPDVPSVEASADGVVRALSDPRPPRDAVTTDHERIQRSGVDLDGESRTPTEQRGCTDDTDHADGSDGVEEVAGTDDDPDADAVHGSADESRRPTTPIAGLAAVERRVALAERLADAETLEEASEAVGSAGGLDGVRALDEAIARDRADLRTLAERVESLRERAESVAVPTETLARIGGEQA
ncbi:hypothetical protein ACFPYI_09455 [Halomarina salina]|uniref:DUF8080 domain-containing protein n=1 Tax=Halomarina salina TaxID=1872699 RepID=A0ABD5RM08_9EURY|nr:hypothetical protein [Halomarina salina]